MMGWVIRSNTKGAKASCSSSSVSSSDSVHCDPEGMRSGTRLLNEPCVASTTRYSK